MQGKTPTYTCVRSAWNKHETELRNFLSRRLSDPHQAEDLLQEVFLKAMHKGDGFCSLGSARAWLFEVARNAVADHFRLRRDQVELPEDLAISDEEPATVDSLSACIPRVLSELDEKDREAIMLCDLQGMKQEEFARVTGLSLSGAKSRLQRARKRMLDHLTKACQVQFDDAGQVVCFVPRPPIS
ncbi:MAG: RNA polymerase sigma factor SigZ [Burkholderiaceae bacterium]|nr:RNA polymerase sigma factor SigZ [Burkholderiaceae bacterium]